MSRLAAVVGLGRVGRHRRRVITTSAHVASEQGDLLLAHLVGHHEHAPVALEGGDDGQPGAGVAAGRLHDRAARLELAGPLGALHHGQPDPVLDRATAGVQVLGLGQQGQGQSRLGRDSRTNRVPPTTSRIESYTSMPEA